MDRTRLTSRLRARAEARLTLVSAPAGFGKTTLLARWLTELTAEQRPRRLAVPGGRRRAARRLLDLPGHRATTGRARGRRAALALLQTGQPPSSRPRHPPQRARRTVRPTSTWSSTTTTSSTAPDLQPSMAFLLDHLPPQCTWSSAPASTRRCRWPACAPGASWSRSAPPTCASPRTRPRPTSTTSRRSTSTPRDVAALETRTEGWIAALQLAALSLQGRDDAAAFIAGFAGDDRYVVDYLADEVLEPPTDAGARLPAPDLHPRPAERTAVRRRHRATPTARPCWSTWTAPTCSSSRWTTRRRWYRYHHLFADVLQDPPPRRAARGGRRAAPPRQPTGTTQAGEPVAAVRHALAAGDIDRAADLAELAVPALQRDRQEATSPPGSTTSRTRWCRPARCWPSVSSAALMPVNEFTGVEERCTTSSNSRIAPTCPSPDGRP